MTCHKFFLVFFLKIGKLITIAHNEMPAREFNVFEGKKVVAIVAALFSIKAKIEIN